MPRPLTLLACAALALTSSARANDAWIEPAEFAPAAASEVAVHLRVGREGQVREVERRPARILRFVLRGPAGLERAVTGEAAAQPAGRVSVAGPGRYALGYVGRPNWVQLSAPAFARLLHEEGQAALLQRRAAEGPAADETSLLYRRCAKSLLQVGGEAPSEADLLLGLPLELVVLGAPAPGAPLPVRLLRDGAPVVGARVAASSLDRFAGERWGETDAEGRAVLTLPHGGRWLLSAVRVEPGEDLARWESLWTSLTLRLPGEVPPARSACATFAAVFARARASGAAARVLGTHRFVMERRYTAADGTPAEGRRQRNLMSYTLTLDEAGAALTVDVEVVPQGGEPFHLVYRVALADGRTERLEAMGHARREGDTLHLRGRGGQREVPWDDAILPKIVGVFVLPMLADQGLPDRLVFRDLTPFGEVTQPYVLRPLAAHETPRPGRLTYVTEEGRLAPTTTAHLDPATHLLQELHTVSQVHRLASGAEAPAAVWHSARVSEQRFAELRADW